MATDRIKWETSGEAAQAVTAVPGDGLRLVADHLDVHLQGGVAWVEGLGRLTKRRCATPAPARARMQDDPSSCCRTDDESSALSGGVSWRVSRHALQERLMPRQAGSTSGVGADHFAVAVLLASCVARTMAAIEDAFVELVLKAATDW
jgi:hypothetical protein